MRKMELLAVAMIVLSGILLLKAKSLQPPLAPKPQPTSSVSLYQNPRLKNSTSADSQIRLNTLTHNPHSSKKSSARSETIVENETDSLDWDKIGREVYERIRNEDSTSEFIIAFVEKNPKGRHDIAEWVAQNSQIADEDKEAILSDYLWHETAVDLQDRPEERLTRTSRAFAKLRDISANPVRLQLIAQQYRTQGLDITR